MNSYIEKRKEKSLVDLKKKNIFSLLSKSL